MEVDIRVLGPLDIRVDGVQIVPTAGKPRQLLALLALRAGRMVPVATLMEEVWGTHIPRSAQTTLQTYVLHLRNLISAALPGHPREKAKEILLTKLGGYQLSDTALDSDVRGFERMVADGAAALTAHEDERAADLFSRALSLWRGAALIDVPVGPVLETESLGMEEARIRALEMRIEADLQLRRDADLVGELRMLTRRNPLNEKFCALFMIALHRSGQSWRALEAFRALREHLVSELGVEPSSRLQRLHATVLDGGRVDLGRPGRVSLAVGG